MEIKNARKLGSDAVRTMNAENESQPGCDRVYIDNYEDRTEDRRTTGRPWG